MSNLFATFHYWLVASVLNDTSSVSKADQLPYPSVPQALVDFINSAPFYQRLYQILPFLVIFITFAGTLFLNLDRIISFFQKYLVLHNAELAEDVLLKKRKQLLTRLQNDISIRKRNSLHNLVIIDLQREEQGHQVGEITLELVPEDTENSTPHNREFCSLNRDNHQTNQQTEPQKIIEFFDRGDIQGKLLILGEPGAGKTTELVSLAGDLTQRAIEDENAPIPIIFELSSWKNDQIIRDWLIEQLPKLYPGLPTTVAEQWISNQEIIPLLDGLDELGFERQDKCIAAINQFLGSTFQPALVVCCRMEEYEQAQNRLKQLNGAIYLRSLSDEQIQQYLKELKRFSIWNETIVNQLSLLELVRKPLFLNILVLAYQGRAIKNDTELFEAFIERQFNNSDDQERYLSRNQSKEKTLYYLVYLARKLEAEGEKDFLIEGIQSTWLESTKQKNVYLELCKPILMLDELEDLSSEIIKIKSKEKLSYSLKQAIFALVFILIELPNNKLRELDSIITIFVTGFSCGSIFGELNRGLIQRLFEGLIGGLIGMLMFGLGLVLWTLTIGGLNSSEIENKNFPNQGILNSLKNGLIVMLISGLTVGLSVGLIIGLNTGLREAMIVWINFGLNEGPRFGLNRGLSAGLIYGLLSGMIVGLNAGRIFGFNIALAHFILRLTLYHNRNIPWNYAQFLDHAAKHRFIQRVGGRYRFMHDLLRKHFAQMPLS